MKIGWFKKRDTRTPEEIEEQLNLDYRLTFGSESGQRVFQDLIRVLHLFEPCYVPGMESETMFREGERNAALYILSRVKTPEERGKLIEEVLENG